MKEYAIVIEHGEYSLSAYVRTFLDASQPAGQSRRSSEDGEPIPEPREHEEE
jgi:hypothetical protein